MTILLDPRVGSGELLRHFKAFDVPVELTPLEFGDVAFSGSGPNGVALIGIERKILPDLVSSMRSKRLSGHQLPGLMSSYDYVCLVVEGVWRCGSGGEVEWLWGRDWRPVKVGNKFILYRELDHYLSSLEHICGVTVQQTQDEMRTVAWIVSRYHWWNDKDWSQHHSHEQIYSPELSQNSNGRGHKPSFRYRTVGAVEQVAARFPGVDRKAWAFGKEFKSVVEMVNAERVRLMEVDGVGKVMAERIYRWVRGE